jgi:hypothetical protein
MSRARSFLVKLLLMLGVVTCGANAFVSIFDDQDVRACAFALIGVLLVLTAGVIALAPFFGPSDAPTVEVP